MATKLKNLKIEKVDFVDEGANPDAHIKMIKRKDGEPTGEKRTENVFKKVFSVIGKAVGINQDDIDSAMEEIQKGDSVSFGEKFNEAKNRKIADEIWDICYALQSSLCSILNDEELDSTSAATAMQESLDEFSEVAKESITAWSSGKATSIVVKKDEVSETELEFMKSAVERLTETINKAKKNEEHIETEEGPENKENLKGDEEMKIDKSKLTDAEKAFLEDIEKRCGVEDDPNTSGNDPVVPQEPTVTKSVPQKSEEQDTEPGQSDIYKGLHPAVAAELQSLKKFKEEAEDKELSAVAKKYAIIGKKEEELVPLLKSLKAAGGTAYNDMIAVLDQAVDTVEKSGAFSEIGKSGHGSNENSAEAKISGIAKGYVEKDPSLSYEQAIAKAWENNPDLLAEYDEREGF